MALELYMLGLVVRDMRTSLEFYRRLGLAVPEGSDTRSHVEIVMGSLTFFLDSKPSRWDPGFVERSASEREEEAGPRQILEFYLKTRAEVDHKHAELVGFGYRSYRAPYETSFGMYFAMIFDPDGNTILLSGRME